MPQPRHYRKTPYYGGLTRLATVKGTCENVRSSREDKQKEYEARRQKIMNKEVMR